MKNFNLIALVTTIVLIFSSCSSNEELLPKETSTDLLKSYTVKRDVNGAYSLDYKTADNTVTQNNKNVKTNTNEIYLYLSDSHQVSTRNRSQDLSIENNELKVGFIDENSGKKPQITIIDDNIVMARNTSDDQMLNDYSITGNEDGTYDLVFNVKEDVAVDFIYNEDDNVYEVHLEKENGTISNFERTFTKEEGLDLNINFVNHIQTAESARNSSRSFTRVPVVIIQ